MSRTTGSRPFPTGRVRASSQRYLRLRDEGIISSAENALQQQKQTDEWQKSPRKKRAVTCKPLSPPRFSPSAIGHGDQEYARAQGETAAAGCVHGKPNTQAGLWRVECSVFRTHTLSRCPERAPPCWEIILAARASFASRKAFRARDRADRLGLASAWATGGCSTSPHAAIPSCCKTTDPSGPAVDQSHLLGPHRSVCYGRCGVPGIFVMDGRREASGFALRAACAVSPCLSDVFGVGEAGEVEIVKAGLAADRAQAAPRRREAWPWTPVEDDLGPQRRRVVFSARCSWRVENPRGLSEFAILRGGERIWTAGHEGRFNLACQNWLQVGSPWERVHGQAVRG